MTKFVQTVQVINQIYLKIIMFGFLIAMIKNTYDLNEKHKITNKYASRCEMNQVSFNFFRMLPFS